MYINIDGHKIHYTTEGVGYPCLIPSLVGTPPYERGFSSELRKHLQLVFVELRGNRSDVGEVSRLTLDVLVDDLERFRAEIGIDRVAVLGHSMHCLLPLRYAVRHSQGISHAILVGGAPSLAPSLEAKREEYWQLLASEERKRLLAENLAGLEKRLQGASAGQAIVIDYVANGPATFYEPRFDCSEFFRGSSWDAGIWERLWGPDGVFAKFDPEVEFPKVMCPVLIVAGAFDFLCPPTLWSGLKDKFARGTYRVFEKSGHWPHLEEQALFDSTLVEWIRNS
jgi:proline iminopeptidase